MISGTAGVPRFLLPQSSRPITSHINAGHHQPFRNNLPYCFKLTSGYAEQGGYNPREEGLLFQTIFTRNTYFQGDKHFKNPQMLVVRIKNQGKMCFIFMCGFQFGMNISCWVFTFQDNHPPAGCFFWQKNASPQHASRSLKVSSRATAQRWGPTHLPQKLTVFGSYKLFVCKRCKRMFRL